VEKFDGCVDVVCSHSISMFGVPTQPPSRLGNSTLDAQLESTPACRISMDSIAWQRFEWVTIGCCWVTAAM